MVGRVERTEWLTPHMVRVVLGGEGLTGFAGPEHTDAYVKLTFPGRDGPIPRRYSVRRWDAGSCRLTVDFVVHGSDGVAGPWAARACAGDLVGVAGPGGAFRPDPDADWHLMVGDESALPAIAASLEQVPPGALTVVRLVCDGPDCEVPLETPGALDLVWLHRRGATDPEALLLDAVRQLAFPRGSVSAFVHGEAGEVRAVRRHLLGERGMDRSALSVSGYWRRHMTDESWRQVKRAWNADQEADVVAAAR
ncbi:siderophore-interacting protein [Geodermatophilus sp. YIM 151500]|uniref:siderophore-interacting protein n=1 Tax=Geodermatophilus sp. YIM 151500 TaxID=2984531 RepID=UPI0021E37CE5|nr:siderophore-interacting protein [Geodermatophilus sp. YIM 151500]MCV2490838.1 siderophore-interacting protein [Geodermatophilus sp. YIM 151500]